VVCLTSFDHVTPAQEVEICGRTKVMPEQTFHYENGQRIDLGSARRRKEFMAYHAGRFAIAD
jgi:hypothetical protein